MSDDNISRLPQPGVILDLDLEERPEGDRPPPFIVKVKDRLLTFADPSDVDWRDLASVEIPADLLRVSLERDDLEFLIAQDMESWKFNKLMEAYYNHHGLEEKIKQAKRQRQFAGI